MKSHLSLKSLLAVTTTVISVLSFNTQAKAFNFGNATLSIGFECNNDVSTLILGSKPLGTWQYSKDAVGDGTGGNHYDLYGMGFMEDAKYAYVAINTYDMALNAGIDTLDSNGKTVYNIGWGDLLINTTGKNVTEANGNLFGVHFGGNNSGVSQVGLYGNVLGSSVAGLHTGGVHENLSAVAKNFAQSKSIPTLQEYQQWSLATYVSYQPDSTQKAFVDVKLSLNDYLQNQSTTVKQAFADANLSFDSYVQRQSSTVKQAFADANLSFDSYVQRQSTTVKQAFVDVNLSFDDYLQKQTTTTKQAFVDVNLSFDDYLKKQPTSTQTKYHNGDSSTVQSVNTAYNNFVKNAQTKVTQTKTSYTTLINNAQKTVSDTKTKYDQFMVSTQKTIGDTKTKYDQFMVSTQKTISDTKTNYDKFIVAAQSIVTTTQNNYTKELSSTNVNNSYKALVSKYTTINTLNDKMFGSLSREQGLAYFDQKGANVIGSGNWLGNIEMLNLDQLIAVGYDKSLFQGKQTIAFRIERSVFAPESIPEPASLFGLATVGLALASRKRSWRSAK
ncbi:PEP-CTERM sorting domain-containing protein [Phormidium sp. LEGE 05292]|uniref:PEP-CTERM sorting domain-containing protein n=1 Tax=[Phormidium] sp. LEGE 05292 TaxID=767427 RepID=UPI001881F6DA|nr:PEP-CTERM sorting domain-containing protein [Phormidium sp. LEGE 05292]MBE9227215.1 PEP-CTERM sorting domain-containing protein [Phormidium sp. LEGE 05292]